MVHFRWVISGGSLLVVYSFWWFIVSGGVCGYSLGANVDTQLLTKVPLIFSKSRTRELI